MSVAIAVAATLISSGLLAAITGLVLRKHPRASLLVAILGTMVAAATAATLIGAPVVFGTAVSNWWPLIVADYFLAMAHRIVNGPYPFFWAPYWIYQVGSFTPLIVLGACLALAAARSAFPSTRRTAFVLVGAACFLLVAYVVAGVYAVVTTWGGVPV